MYVLVALSEGRPYFQLSNDDEKSLLEMVKFDPFGKSERRVKSFDGGQAAAGTSSRETYCQGGEFKRVNLTDQVASKRRCLQLSQSQQVSVHHEARSNE